MVDLTASKTKSSFISACVPNKNQIPDDESMFLGFTINVAIANTGLTDWKSWIQDGGHQTGKPLSVFANTKAFDWT